MFANFAKRRYYGGNLNIVCVASYIFMSLIIALCSVFSVCSFADYGDFFISEPFYSKQTASSRELLTENERVIFDAIIAAEPGTGELEFEEFYGEPITKNDYDEMDFDRITFAIFRDCPGIFWFEGMRISSTPATARGDEPVMVKIEIPIEKTVKETLDDTVSAVQSAICNVNFENCTTRYELLGAIHDYLCEKIAFDSALKNEECESNVANDRVHNVAGALCDGRAASQGYAKAFKLFCDRFKIPCIVICSENYMWNGVLMDDGNWYYTDVFADDENDTISRDFFLVGAYTEDENNGFLPFAESHEALPDSATPTVDFSEFEYKITEPTGIFTAASHKLCIEQRLFKISIADKSEPIYCNGIPVSPAPNANGDKFTAGGAEYTCIILGDVNCDGKCTEADCSLAMEKAVSVNRTANENSPSDLSADFNCDGVVDALDCTLIEQLAAGHYVYSENS